LWVNLITDGLPALALGMDAGGSRLMDRPPRKERSLLDLRRQLRLVVYGAAMAGGVLTVYALGGDDPARVRTMGFTTLVLAQLIFALRVRVEEGGRPGRNRLLQLAMITSVLLQIAVVHTPLGNRVLDSVPLRGSDWLLVGAGLLVAGAALEVAVRMRRSPIG
jgi:Ca2+-transporting ATPase